MRFAIRDLLWLTVVVALGAAWWSNYAAMREAQQHSEYLEEAISNAGFVPSGNYFGPNLMKQEHLEELMKMRAEAEKLRKD